MSVGPNAPTARAVPLSTSISSKLTESDAGLISARASPLFQVAAEYSAKAHLRPLTFESRLFDASCATAFERAATQQPSASSPDVSINPAADRPRRRVNIASLLYS